MDMQALSNAYQKLAQLTHPDKFANAGNSEKLMAVQKNAQVNDGYQVLKRPVSRAEHLLALRGVYLQHEQQTMQDPEFLMQQMEWREQLEDIEQQNEPLDSLDILDKEIASHIQQQTEQLSTSLAKHDDAGDQQAAILIRKLKFLEKLRSEIERKEEELDDY